MDDSDDDDSRSGAGHTNEMDDSDDDDSRSGAGRTNEMDDPDDDDSRSGEGRTNEMGVSDDDDIRSGAGRTNEMEDSDDDDIRSAASLSSSTSSVEARTGPNESPESSKIYGAIPTPPPESNSSETEAHVCKSMNAIRQFATTKAASLRELKRAAKRLGLVVTMGSRARRGLVRIGFGLKASVRRLANAVGQYPLSFFKFNQRKDGFLHPGKKLTG